MPGLFAICQYEILYFTLETHYDIRHGYFLLF